MSYIEKTTPSPCEGEGRGEVGKINERVRKNEVIVWRFRLRDGLMAILVGTEQKSIKESGTICEQSEAILVER